MLSKTTFIELSRRIDRPIVLFGSGNVAKKTIRKIGKGNCAYIVDNSVNLHGESYNDLPIKAPKDIKPGVFILICSTAIGPISDQLVRLGLKPEKDFTISPILNDLLAIEELESLSKTIYFTSGSIPEDDPNRGGGLYKCTVKGLEVGLNKIYKGPCYGSVRLEEKIYFVDTDRGILEHSKNGNIDLKCELPKGSRAHGISFNQMNHKFYVTCSNLDVVLEVDRKGWKIQKEFRLSSKKGFHNEPMHHCNDNWSIENSLFVSMFSSTGNWKRDSFDGCIAEFDLNTGDRLSDVCTGLYMPHNVMMFDGSLHVLDSLPGHLRFNNFTIQGTFPAFTRGLTFNQGLYFIGQSKNRNYSKVMGISNNISIDCGIIVFNPILKASRFLQFPYTIGEIHSIIV